jgi:hypothetical protein
VAGVVVDAVGLAPAAVAALPVVDRVAAREARAADVAVRAAVDVAKAKAVTAKADVEMAEASSSRT